MRNVVSLCLVPWLKLAFGDVGVKLIAKLEMNPRKYCVFNSFAVSDFQMALVLFPPFSLWIMGAP